MAKFFPSQDERNQGYQRVPRIECGDSSRSESGNSLSTHDLDPESQEVLAKLLGDALDKQIKVVNKKNKEVHEVNGLGDEGEDGIFLFSNSKTLLSRADLEKEALRSQQKIVQKKPSFKRRKIDDTDSEDESTKLESVAVSYDWVIGSQY